MFDTSSVTMEAIALTLYSLDIARTRQSFMTMTWICRFISGIVNTMLREKGNGNH